MKTIRSKRKNYFFSVSGVILQKELCRAKLFTPPPLSPESSIWKAIRRCMGIKLGVIMWRVLRHFNGFWFTFTGINVRSFDRWEKCESAETDGFLQWLLAIHHKCLCFNMVSEFWVLHNFRQAGLWDTSFTFWPKNSQKTKTLRETRQTFSSQQQSASLRPWKQWIFYFESQNESNNEPDWSKSTFIGLLKTIHYFVGCCPDFITGNMLLL